MIFLFLHKVGVHGFLGRVIRKREISARFDASQISSV